MERNFSRVNSRPPWPIRTCRNSAGPELVSRIISTIANSSGSSSTKPTAARSRSTAPLTTRRAPANSGSSTCSSGSPVTGRMCSRGPATSISPGATTRSISVPSSCQDSRRSRAGPTLAPAATATVSARAERTASATSSSPPSSGMPSPTIRAPSPVDKQAPTTCMPQ